MGPAFCGAQPRQFINKIAVHFVPLIEGERPTKSRGFCIGIPSWLPLLSPMALPKTYDAPNAKPLEKRLSTAAVTPSYVAFIPERMACNELSCSTGAMGCRASWKY